MIRIVSALLILWGCAFAQAPIDIVSSTSLGMPCGGISTLGCMPDKDCGWMVVVRTGDAAAFAGKLTYADAAGKEQTATVTATATGEYTALAFRVGVFRNGGNRFVSVEVSSLKASATVRQDAEGTVITVGETTWGPPKQARAERVVVPLESGDTLLRFREAGNLIVALKFIGGKVIVEQPEVATHVAPIAHDVEDIIAWRAMPYMVWACVTPQGMKIEQSPLDLHSAEMRPSLDLLATIGASFGIHNGTARKFELLNLKEVK